MKNRRNLLWWSTIALTLSMFMMIAYFVHGGLHGMYADDYVYKYSAYDLATGSWKPIWSYSPARTLNYLLVPNFANSLPAYEFQARLIIAALLVLIALLLGALAYRLSNSKWIALLGAAFFLAPVYAVDAVLWFTGAVIYLPSLLLLLIGLHLILSCRSARKQFPILVAAVAALCAMVLFIESGFFVLLLIPIIVWTANKQGARPNLKPALIATSATYALFIPYAFLALRSAPVVANHGATTFDPIYIVSERIPQVLNGVLDYVRDWQPGGMLRDALDLGLRAWLSTPVGLALIGLGLIGSILTALLCPLCLERTESPGRGVRLFFLGILWMVLSLSPVLFFVGLPISSTVLLFPSAGLALALAGFMGWLGDRLHRGREIAVRVIVLLAGISVLINSLAMAGLVQVYQLRWERDQTQLTALQAAVPSLPSSGIWVLSVALDNKTVGPRLGHPTTLDQHLYGLFQIQWAAEPALRMEYGQAQLRVVAQDQSGVIHLTGFSHAANGAINGLTFEGLQPAQEVPIGQLLAFTYRENELTLFDRVTIIMPDGGRSQAELPLASQVAAPQVRTRALTLKLEGGPP